MPSIHLFGAKTLSGGDDLHIPCVLALGLRVVQLIVLLVPIWNAINRDIWRKKDSATTSTCGELFESILITYAAVSTFYLIVAVFTEIRLSLLSSRGTPTEPGDRTEKVERLLERKLLWATVGLEGAVWIIGCALFIVNRRGNNCESEIPDQRATVLGDAEGTVSDLEDDFWRQMNDWWYRNDITTVDTSAQFSSSSPPYSLFKDVAWWWVAVILLWFTQLSEWIVTFVLVLKLKCGRTDASHVPTHAELTEEMWVERCTNLCQCLGMTTCFLFGGKEVAMGDYGDVARALADYFETGGVLDLVPSDVVMGFMVLQRLQRVRVREARRVVQQQIVETDHDGQPPVVPMLVPNSDSGIVEDALAPAPSSRSSVSTHSRQTTYLMHQEGSETFYEAQLRKVLSRNSPADIEVLREGARFAKYALAIYTWMLYVYRYPISGIPRLLCHNPFCCFSCSRGRRRDSSCCDDPVEGDGLLCEETEHVAGDNCCQLHKTALLMHAGIEEADLVYAQLKSSFNEIPYCILLDHNWRIVVVSIRGTFSLEDCITDVLIEPEPLDRLGEEFGFDGEGQYCHGGVAACARIVHRDLERHGILDRLLRGNNPQFPGYTLRIVGHSLGAATATLLSYMMKERFPTLRCLNYSPPGMCMSWKLATECQEFCTSFVLDCDLVPRLSLSAMEHLRDEVLDLIGRVRVPKIQVANELVKGFSFSSWLFCTDEDDHQNDEGLKERVTNLLYERADVPAVAEYQRQLRDFRDIQSERKLRRGNVRTVELYPPGRIVHMTKTSERKSCMHGLAKCLTCCTTNVGFNYTPVWANNTDFNEIVVSPTMGTDHFPNRVCFEIEGVATDYGIDVSAPSTYADVEQPANILHR